MIRQNILLGIVIGLISYSSLYLGKGIQKLAVEGIKGAGTLRSRHSGIWIFGTVLTALPVFIQWAALLFAPVHLIAPLEGFGLIVLVLFSRTVLKEELSLSGILGIAGIITGTLLVTLRAETAEISGGSLLRYGPLFLLAGGVLAGEGLLVLLSLKKRWGMLGTLIGATAGSFMALQTFTKRLTVLPEIRLAATAAVFISAVMTLVVTQYGFVKAKASRVVPAFTSTSIVFATLLGFVVLRERLLAVQTIGIALIIAGVIVLTSGTGKKRGANETSLR
jgi:uncharacterized membrane protein